MDPNTCFEQLCEALRRGDADDAGEFAKYLAEWIRKGGFPPRKLEKE